MEQDKRNEPVRILTEETVQKEETPEQITVFRRPDPKDEADRIGRGIVRRMIEAGVIEI